VLDHLSVLGITEAIREPEYIDIDYRNEYRNFYFKTFVSLPDRCDRLHFWQAERYAGYMCVRPVVGAPVGRTMLPAGRDLAPWVTCQTTARAQPYGLDLRTAAAPFISQDQRYGRCAHAVVWMISHYHHLATEQPRYLMSDIVDAASRFEFERVAPSSGMTIQQIGAAFRYVGLSAVRYSIETLSRGDLQQLVRHYMNSRLPLAIGTATHITAVIGCGEDEDGFFFVLSDDELGPYRKVHEQAKEWRWLFVPLPGRIYLLAEQFERRARSMLQTIVGNQPGLQEVLPENLRVRCYVQDSRVYRSGVRERLAALGPRVYADHLRVSAPRWIWVAELQDLDAAQEGDACVIGEIVADATSSPQAINWLFGNMPQTRLRWMDAGRRLSLVREESLGLERYPSGGALPL
jgi:hypothetical protein